MIEMVFLYHIMKASSILTTFSGLLETFELFSENKSWEVF